jgi:hypothetical protein
MSTLTPIPLVLDRKDPGRGHVVVGDEHPMQVGFLAEFIGGAEVIPVAKLDDSTALQRLEREGNFIFVLPSERHLGISPDTRAQVKVWEAEPIKKDSAALNALIRQAMVIIHLEELDKTVLRNVGNMVIQQCGDTGSPQGMIWAATWLLTDLTEVGGEGWKQPWERPWGWTNTEPLAKRLHVLYRDLGAWVFARDDDRKGAERLGVNPSRFQWLKQIQLSERRVDRALCLLSAWRAAPDDGFTTALKIGAIFEV